MTWRRQRYWYTLELRRGRRFRYRKKQKNNKKGLRTNSVPTTPRKCTGLSGNLSEFFSKPTSVMHLNIDAASTKEMSDSHSKTSSESPTNTDNELVHSPSTSDPNSMTSSESATNTDNESVHTPSTSDPCSKTSSESPANNVVLRLKGGGRSKVCVM